MICFFNKLEQITIDGGRFPILCCPQTTSAILGDEQIVKYILQHSVQGSVEICIGQQIRWDNIQVPLAIKCILMLSGPISENLQNFC